MKILLIILTLLTFANATEIAITKAQMEKKIALYKIENYDYLAKHNHYKETTLTHYYKLLASLPK